MKDSEAGRHIVFTKAEAIENQQELAACYKQYQHDFRLLLLKAHERKAHVAMGFDSYWKYLKSTEEKYAMSQGHMLRQYKAGRMELILFDDEELVGELPESVTRILSENVTEGKAFRVYFKAQASITTKTTKTTRRKNPTAKQLVEAAKALGFYTQQESKKSVKSVAVNASANNQDDDDDEQPKTPLREIRVAIPSSKKAIIITDRVPDTFAESNDDDNEQSEKPSRNSSTFERAIRIADREPDTSNIIKIKKRVDFDDEGEKLLRTHGHSDTTLLRNMIVGSQNKTLCTTFKRLTDTYTAEELDELVSGIDDALEDCPSQQKRAQRKI